MKVMFGVPTYNGLVCVPFLDSLKETTLLFKEEGIDCELEIVYGSCLIQAARNELVCRFLKSDCDKLLFLDDDLSWDPKGALAVVTANRPVSCGVYPQKGGFDDHAPFLATLKCSEEGIPLSDEAYLRAVGAPTGFMCVSRSVFTNIKSANPHLRYDEYKLGTEEFTTKFDFFPQGVHDGRFMGEDYAFCLLWAKLGGEISVVPDITFGHHKGVESWYGNMWSYIKQLPGGIDYGKEGAEKGIWYVQSDPRCWGEASQDGGPQGIKA